MKVRQRISDAISNESGAVLALALMTTTVLAVFSLTAIMTSMQGLKMGVEYQAYQNSVYIADGGIDFAPGLIERTLFNGYVVTTADSANSAVVQFIDPANPNSQTAGVTRFQNKISAVITNSGDTAAQTPNIKMTYPTGETTNIVVEYAGTRPMPGSSTESAARYEGIGSGGSGGVGIYYRVDAYNYNPKLKESSTVRANFKCVDGGQRCL
jgi:hypothetical protein